MKFNKDLFTISEQNTVVTYDNLTINVRTYISMKDLYDGMMIAIQKSNDNGFINPLKAEVYLNLNLVYLYTDLEFSDEDRQNEVEIYDTLRASGLLTKILEAIPAEQYDEYIENANETIEYFNKYNSSAAAIFAKLVDELPANAELAAQIVNNFDKEKYSEVTNFAKALNGNRAIEED